MFHFNCIITKKVIKISILNPTSTRKRSNIHQISNILCLSKTHHRWGQMDRSPSHARAVTHRAGTLATLEYEV